MKKVKVNLGKKSYEIVIGSDILDRLPLFLRDLNVGNTALIITNPKIKNLFAAKLSLILKKHNFNHSYLIIGDSEKSKSEKIAFNLIGKIAKFDKGRGIFIIALGGGVVGDVSGFVASIYKRGIPFIQVPTTLLSEVDSSIGGKAAIDLDVAKNLVGSFYQPKLVFSDIALLKTLPKRQILNGLGEVIKYGIIKDPEFFNYIEKNLKKIVNMDKKALEHIVYVSSAIKAGYVEKDEFDTLGIRAELNLGHTIGHAVEAAGKYSKKYNHGESIAFGIVVATEISKRLGLINSIDSIRIIKLIGESGLPVKIRGVKLDKIINATFYDKKVTHGVNRFVLPVKIGKSKVVKNISLKLIKEVLKERIS